MFKALEPMLSKLDLLTITICRESDGRLRVNVIPKAKEGCEQASVPLSLCASAEDLDAEFASTVLEYRKRNESLSDQLAEFQKQADAVAAAAEKAKEEAGRKAGKTKANATSSSITSTSRSVQAKPKAAEAAPALDTLF